MNAEIHQDVASYALGILDERDTLHFEEHLATCSQCMLELESMLPVVDLLADVDGRDLMVAERSDSDGRLFERVAAAVDGDRQRARSRRLYGLAAGFVLVVLLTGLGFVTGARFGESGATTAQPPGAGGVATPSGGERFSVTDPASGVHAEVRLRSTPWGTGVSFALSGLSGPRECQLVLTRKNGKSEVISSWQVPPAGYGTAAQPNALVLEAATSVDADDIDRLQVRVIDDGTPPDPLVTVPL